MRAENEIKINRTTGFLKLVALVAMLVDHMGARLFASSPLYWPMRLVGRVAFPIFAYCVAVGCVYTRNIGKYALRVGLVAVLVQPLYMVAMNHLPAGEFNWADNAWRLDLLIQRYYTGHLNIFFTLLSAILLIWTIRQKKYIWTALVFAVVWYVQGAIDYGILGVGLIVLFYAFRDRPLPSLVWMTMYMAWWGLPSSAQRAFSPQGFLSLSAQFWALLALPLIYRPLGRWQRSWAEKIVYWTLTAAVLIAFPMRTSVRPDTVVFWIFYSVYLAVLCLPEAVTTFRLNKLVFYLFYPAHMGVILLIAKLMGK